MRQITVTVDGTPYRVWNDAEVHTLVDLLPPGAQLALKTGQARLTDRHGHEVGSGGGLADGTALRIEYLA